MGKMADGRYLAARYMPKLLYGIWKIKRGLKEPFLENDRKDRMEAL